MARIDGATAERVCEVILELDDVDNRLVRAELLEGNTAQPPHTAAQLIDKVEPSARDATAFSADEFGALISEFADGGVASGRAQNRQSPSRGLACTRWRRRAGRFFPRFRERKLIYGTTSKSARSRFRN